MLMKRECVRNEIFFKYPWQSFSSKVRKVKYDSFLWITLISDYLELRSIGNSVAWKWKRDRENGPFEIINEIIEFSDNKTSGIKRIWLGDFSCGKHLKQSTTKSQVVDRTFQLNLIHASDSLNSFNSMKDHIYLVSFNFEMAVILNCFQLCNLYFCLLSRED